MTDSRPVYALDDGQRRPGEGIVPRESEPDPPHLSKCEVCGRVLYWHGPRPRCLDCRRRAYAMDRPPD